MAETSEAPQKAPETKGQAASRKNAPQTVADKSDSPGPRGKARLRPGPKKRHRPTGPLGKIGQTSAQAGTKAEGQARAIAGAKAGPKPLAKAKKKPSMGELLRHPARVIKNRLRESKRAGQQPSPSDYGELAKAWELLGADSGQVPARLAIRDLRLRLLVFLLTGLLATWGIWHGGPGFLAVPVILATLVGAATSLWRLSLLKEKRFVSFPSWLKSGCGALASRNSGPCQRESADQDGQGDQVAFAENGTSVGQNTLNHETAMVAKEAIAMETKETL